jgi:hypothetical protein
MFTESHCGFDKLSTGGIGKISFFGFAVHLWPDSKIVLMQLRRTGLSGFRGIVWPRGVFGLAGAVDFFFGFLDFVLNLVQAFFELGQAFTQTPGHVRQLFAEYQKGDNKDYYPFPAAGHS